MSILLMLLVINAAVVLHELGHYLASLLCHVPVKSFNVGFGRRILGFNAFGNEFNLRLLLFGGYVEFADTEEGSSPLDSRSFIVRVFIALAGIGMNLITAFALLVYIYSSGGVLSPNGSGKPMVRYVLANSPAEHAHLHIGDTIESITMDTEVIPVETLEDLSKTVNSADEGKQITLTVLRGTKELQLPITPVLDAQLDRLILGITAVSLTVSPRPLSKAISSAWFSTSGMFVNYFAALPQGIAGLVTSINKVHSSETVQGPIGMVTSGIAVTHEGKLNLVTPLIMLSIGLAAINILPLPMLDGWHVVRALYQLLRQKPIPVYMESSLIGISLVLLVVLFSLTTLSDILRLANH